MTRASMAVAAGILIVSLTCSACSYFGYRTGKNMDEHGDAKSFPIAMQVLDDLAPEDEVQILTDSGTRIEGFFLDLMPAETNDPEPEPLPGLGERATVTTSDRGRTLEGDLVRYGSGHVIVRTDAGEQSVRWSRIHSITTTSGEQLDIDDLLEEVLRRRMAQVSAVRVLRTDLGIETAKDIPLDKIVTVRRPAGKFFRGTGLVVGAFFDTLLLYGILYGAAGTIADAND